MRQGYRVQQNNTENSACNEYKIIIVKLVYTGNLQLLFFNEYSLKNHVYICVLIIIRASPSCTEHFSSEIRELLTTLTPCRRSQRLRQQRVRLVVYYSDTYEYMYSSKIFEKPFKRV